MVRKDFIITLTTNETSSKTVLQEIIWFKFQFLSMKILLREFLTFILISFICSENATYIYNTDNIANKGYEIIEFEDQSVTVILNSTEWEVTLDYHDFDQPWMRLAGTDSIIR